MTHLTRRHKQDIRLKILMLNSTNLGVAPMALLVTVFSAHDCFSDLEELIVSNNITAGDLAPSAVLWKNNYFAL